MYQLSNALAGAIGLALFSGLPALLQVPELTPAGPIPIADRVT